jgi:hypothetical protein
MIHFEAFVGETRLHVAARELHRSFANSDLEGVING